MEVNVIVFLVVVAVFSIMDVSNKYIYIWHILTLLGFGIIFNVITRTFTPVQIVTGMIPGGILLALDKIKKVGLGSGDIMIFCVIGSCLGLEMVCSTMIISAVVCSVCIAFMLALKKVSKKSEVPFIPFISIGMALSIIFGG